MIMKLNVSPTGKVGRIMVPQSGMNAGSGAEQTGSHCRRSTTAEENTRENWEVAFAERRARSIPGKAKRRPDDHGEAADYW